jgi:hypothetical protein
MQVPLLKDLQVCLSGHTCKHMPVVRLRRSSTTQACKHVPTSCFPRAEEAKPAPVSPLEAAMNKGGMVRTLALGSLFAGWYL